jgi:hypothetical protein
MPCFRIVFYCSKIIIIYKRREHRRPVTGASSRQRWHSRTRERRKEEHYTLQSPFSKPIHSIVVHTVVAETRHTHTPKPIITHDKRKLITRRGVRPLLILSSFIPGRCILYTENNQILARWKLYEEAKQSVCCCVPEHILDPKVHHGHQFILL